MIVPQDGDGSAIKVPGRVMVVAYEIAPGGVKTPIGRWDVKPEDLHKYWRGGLLATGYYLVFQWDKPPCTERLRIMARLTTLDGRVYETDKDVDIKPKGPVRMEELPPPGASRPAVRLGKVNISE